MAGRQQTPPARTREYEARAWARASRRRVHRLYAGLFFACLAIACLVALLVRRG
jgi:hypothetical protein